MLIQPLPPLITNRPPLHHHQRPRHRQHQPQHELLPRGRRLRSRRPPAASPASPLASLRRHLALGRRRRLSFLTIQRVQRPLDVAVLAFEADEFLVAHIDARVLVDLVSHPVEELAAVGEGLACRRGLSLFERLALGGGRGGGGSGHWVHRDGRVGDRQGAHFFPPFTPPSHRTSCTPRPLPSPPWSPATTAPWSGPPGGAPARRPGRPPAAPPCTWTCPTCPWVWQRV